MMMKAESLTETARPCLEGVQNGSKPVKEAGESS